MAEKPRTKPSTLAERSKRLAELERDRACNNPCYWFGKRLQELFQLLNVDLRIDRIRYSIREKHYPRVQQFLGNGLWHGEDEQGISAWTYEFGGQRVHITYAKKNPWFYCIDVNDPTEQYQEYFLGLLYSLKLVPGNDFYTTETELDADLTPTPDDGVFELRRRVFETTVFPGLRKRKTRFETGKGNKGQEATSRVEKEEEGGLYIGLRKNRNGTRIYTKVLQRPDSQGAKVVRLEFHLKNNLDRYGIQHGKVIELQHIRWDRLFAAKRFDLRGAAELAAKRMFGPNWSRADELRRIERDGQMCLVKPRFPYRGLLIRHLISVIDTVVGPSLDAEHEQDAEHLVPVAELMDRLVECPFFKSGDLRRLFVEVE